MNEENKNINQNLQTKNEYVGLIVIVILLLILAILAISFNREPSTQVVDNSPSPSSTPSLIPPNDPLVIVSSEIMNGVNPINDDQFWASMYRRDYKNDKMYFVINRQANILREMPEADAVSFKVLATSDGAEFSYAQDKNGIYCNENLIPSIDASTFEYNRWSALYAKDSINVYINCKIAKEADVQSFMRLGDQGYESHYAKDKNRVYYKDQVLENASPSSFKILDGKGYSKDDVNLYFEDKLVGKTNGKIAYNSSGKITLTTYGSPTAIFHSQSGSDILSEITISRFWGSNTLQVHDQKIYFIDPSGNLKYFDPLTNLSYTLPLPGLTLLDNNQAPKIVSFFVQKNHIYLLYGNNCNEYLTQCNLELLRYDMLTQTVEKIASNVGARRIEGFDEETGNIYLTWRDGDAGCSWVTFYIYNINSKAKISEEKASGCAGEDEEARNAPGSEWRMYNEKVDKILEKVKGDIVSTDAVYIDNGRITLPPDSPENPSGSLNIQYFIN